MAEGTQFERLDSAIDALLARRDSEPVAAEAELAPLVGIGGALRAMPREAFRRRLKAELERAAAPAAVVEPVREGFRTMTPYLTAKEALELIEFMKKAFGAEELLRMRGANGGIHSEVRIGDSIVMVRGGRQWTGTPMPTSLWLFVEDADAVYASALAAGATSINAPIDQPYGDREAGVTDVAGNQWFIATHRGTHPGKGYVREGMNTVNLYLHPAGALEVLDFLERGLGAETLERHVGPDGTLAHARVRMGTSAMGMSEARGEYPNMPTAVYMYVPDVDAAYERATRAGGEPLFVPVEQPHGDRQAGVRDAAGNCWYLASRVKNVPCEELPR
jgi:PhnB protein